MRGTAIYARVGGESKLQQSIVSKIAEKAGKTNGILEQALRL